MLLLGSISKIERLCDLFSHGVEMHCFFFWTETRKIAFLVLKNTIKDLEQMTPTL